MLAKKGFDLKTMLIQAQTDRDKSFESVIKKIERAETKINKFENNIINHKRIISEMMDIDERKASQQKRLDSNILKLSAAESVLMDTKEILEELEKERNFLEALPNVDKINKRVLESLGAVGALKSFGVTRKFIISNIVELTDPKKIMDLDFEDKEEYLDLDRIQLEMSKLGFILNSPFPADLKNFEIEEDMPVLYFLEKNEAFKKDGTKYFKIKFLDKDGNILELSDFNNKAGKFKIGDLIFVGLTRNGKYMNIRNMRKFDQNKLQAKEYKPVVLKLQILEKIPVVNRELYSSIEVYDGTDLVAVMR